MDASPKNGPHEPAALDVWLDFLAENPAYEEPDFQRLCERLPELRAGLLALHARATNKSSDKEAPKAEVDTLLPGAVRSSDPLERLAHLALPVRRGARYVKESELARGGMGIVHRARDVELNRTLAVKEMSAGPAAEHLLSATRFLEEAQITAQLDHPGIVPIHELGVDEQGRLFFAMKLVNGRELREVLEDLRHGAEGWTQTRALSVLLRVCEAMAYAHSRGVVHRDLKPSNVMVGNFGEVFVMDWGLARVIGRNNMPTVLAKAGQGLESLHTERREEREETPDSPFVTLDGAVLGTPSYMPPEQARGEMNLLSPRSDVYAIGAILYEMLAGISPYQLKSGRMGKYAMLARVVEGPPTPLLQVAPQTPAELVAICERAMARDPEQRYPDTLALGEDIRAYLEHRVVSAYQIGAWAEARKWVERNRALALASAAAVAVLLLGLATSSTLYVEARESTAEAVLQSQKAEANALLASENERTASIEATRANQRSEEVLRLSASQRLNELEREAEVLWPPHPDLIPRYDRWLESARKLVDGLEPGVGEPYLGHRAKLAELAAHASLQEHAESPLQPGALQAELERLRSRLRGLREARDSRAATSAVGGPDPESFEFAELLARAWPLVHPDRSLFGQEQHGLVLARAAIDRAGDDGEFLAASDVLAWALFACGQADEAELAMEATQGLEATTGQEGRLSSSGRLRAEIGAFRAGRPSPTIVALESRIRLLEESTEGGTTLHFEVENERWWYEQLARLVQRLETLADPEQGLISGLSPEHGWGIERRRAFAEGIEERSISGPEAKRRWSEARASIGNVRECPLYLGLDLAPQLGLLPLGRDPHSGLWEFAHLISGAEPERGANGQLEPTAESGLVLVLVPGGRFWMGAQSKDPNRPNFDPLAEALSEGTSGPVHEVWLSPYFLSKYEMTRAQWSRITGNDPGSGYEVAISASRSDGRATEPDLHPIEQVTWQECERVLARLALALPTEAQWEHAARGRTGTPWWTGSTKESIAGAANVLDLYANTHGNGAAPGAELWLNDGHTVHAPIGSFAPNPFGLHDVIGNVWEWCRDKPGTYGVELQMDPLLEPGDTDLRQTRGGSYDDPASLATSAQRAPSSPTARMPNVGVRPARRVER